MGILPERKGVGSERWVKKQQNPPHRSLGSWAPFHYISIYLFSPCLNYLVCLLFLGESLFLGLEVPVAKVLLDITRLSPHCTQWILASSYGIQNGAQLYAQPKESWGSSLHAKPLLWGSASLVATPQSAVPILWPSSKLSKASSISYSAKLVHFPRSLHLRH